VAVGNTKDEPGHSGAMVKGGSMTGGRPTYMSWAGLACVGLLTVGGCTTRPAVPPTMSDPTRLCGQGYTFPTTVVSVQSGPQWLLSRPMGCPEPTPLTQVPNKPTVADLPPKPIKAGIHRLQGLPTFSSGTLAARPGDMSRAPGSSPDKAVIPGPTGSPTTVVCRREPEVRHRRVSFAMGSADLSERAQRDLTELRIEEILYLRVEGYTDPTGSRETNQELGMARAEAVAKVLQARVKGPVQVEVVGRGGCCFLPNHAESRRVEVMMLLQGRCADSSEVERRSEAPPVTPVVSAGATHDSGKP
jgi:hypothetical protein